MGAVYTNTENAIRCSDNIAGIPGRRGDRGDRGITGNNWVYLATSPHSEFVLQGAVDQQGNSFPTNVGGTWPSSNDKWLNYITGDWFIYDGANWVQQPSNFTGPKGPDNIARTDVSFSKYKDTRGFTMTTYNEDVLIGYVIFPGKTLAGTINSVKILTQCNTAGKNLKVTLKLVNVNATDDTGDDIIVASTLATHTLNGDGGDSSWDINNLSIITANVPDEEELLAVYGRMIEAGSGDIQQKGIRVQSASTLYRYVNVAHLMIT